MTLDGTDSTRAISTPVGMALLVFLTLVGATTVVLLGGTAIGDVEESARSNQAASAMT